MTVVHDLGAGRSNDEAIHNVTEGARRKRESLVYRGIKNVEGVLANHFEFPSKGADEKEAESTVETKEVGEDFALKHPESLSWEVGILNGATNK